MSAGGNYFELDPDKAAAEAAGKPPLDYAPFGPSPPREQITFRHLPDLEKMQRGDVILVRPKKTPAPPSQFIAHAGQVLGGSVAWYIQRTQANLRAAPHHLWVHAGIYVGYDLMIEAVTPRVSINSFSRYSPTHFIRVLRYPNLTPDEAYAICITGARRIGDKYDVGGIRGLAMAFFNWATPRANLVKKAFICSELVQNAFLYGASKDAGHVAGERTPTPSDLSDSRTLEDKDIGWRRLG